MKKPPEHYGQILPAFRRQSEQLPPRHKSRFKETYMPIKSTNNTSALRLAVLEHIASAFWEGRLEESVDKIPFRMRPRTGNATRCCIYKDRAVIRERIIGALGFRLEEERDESVPLKEYAERALAREKPTWPILTVCDIACHGCLKARYFVSDACQACVARSCQGACRFNAISFAHERSYIDADNCRNCGLCKDACPYQAIVHLNVPCEAACPVQAIHKGKDGRAIIDFDKCTSCGRCMRACPFGAIIERREVLEVLRAIRDGAHVTALMAPAIVGQYEGGPGRIAAALRELGFSDVIEVAEGADMTSRHEADEFVERMERGDKFMTTSCCPAYVEAVRRHAPELLPYVSATPTPMHYAAGIARERHPETVTVFIGPCVAKRQEGLRDDLVDFVLTFEEVGALFSAKGINVAECEEAPLGTASGEGRGYAVSGGVAAAVKKLVGDRFEVKPLYINGLSLKGIRQLQQYAAGDCPGNLVEVMTCEGGCVGGAGVMAPARKAARAVENFSKKGKV